ncbi:MAG: hypothetical protein AAB343_04115 [Patescibacteria group bacterium]
MRRTQKSDSEIGAEIVLNAAKGKEATLTRLIKTELKHASENSAVGAQQYFAVATYAKLLNAMYMEYELVLKQAVDDMKRLQATIK